MQLDDNVLIDKNLLIGSIVPRRNDKDQIGFEFRTEYKGCILHRAFFEITKIYDLYKVFRAYEKGKIL